MQLRVSLSMLLATLLVLCLHSAEAAPAKRGAGRITMPLRRVPSKRGDLHGHIYALQHLNRGQRRLARMTGRAEPSHDELRANIQKRVAMIEEEAFQKRALEERFNRPNVEAVKAGMKASGNSLAKGAKGANNVQGGKGKTAGAVASGGAIAAAGGAAAKGATAVGGKAAANDGSTAGVSQIDIDAQNDPSLLTAANPPTANNSLGLAIESADTGYIATIQMGTPPQNFNILMDSGSADFWVGNADNCQSEAGGGCGTHTFLGTSTSSSFKTSNSQFQVTYGTGQVAGTLCQDDVTMAGLTLKAHTFGTAQIESEDFSSDQVPFDGLMGLAQQGLSEQKTPTPVESLASQGLINGAITSFKISRLSDQKNDGEITFGDVDPTKFQANTLETFANVNTQGFWEGAMPAVSVDGQDLGLQGRTAILDTGTTLIQAPQADATAVHQLIAGAKSAGQGMFTVPCTTNASVALTFGKTSFAIEPQDLAFAPVDNNDPTGDCISGIGAGNIGGANEWLVGDVFLKNAYFSTDEDKNQISLAKLA
ncbi:hypothetical protein PLICRDRAFT_29044 [Plicaturopsis crispa FD-325 SS-3]|nr:hypothetical protein PLICRDRAFT_29044 [Plicaturopsis crispa FD-325 SS-3]